MTLSASSFSLGGLDLGATSSPRSGLNERSVVYVQVR